MILKFFKRICNNINIKNRGFTKITDVIQITKMRMSFYLQNLIIKLVNLKTITGNDNIVSFQDL